MVTRKERGWIALDNTETYGTSQNFTTSENGYPNNKTDSLRNITRFGANSITLKTTLLGGTRLELLSATVMAKKFLLFGNGNGTLTDLLVKVFL